MNFSEDELVAFKEVWSYYADKEKDTIASDDLGLVMRNCGKNPLEADLQALRSEFGKGDLNFETFLDMMEHPIKGGSVPGERELLECFAVFDAEGAGKLEAQEFRKIMRDIGEGLSAKEFELIMAEANHDPDNTGYIDYRKIVETLFAKDKKEKD